LSILDIQTNRAFIPLLEPARYKGAHGGRGSGKSHFFAEMLVDDCVRENGMLAVCIREVQKTLAQSSKRLIERKIAALGVGSKFKIFSDRIATPGGGLIIFQGMRDHTAESIKSLEGFKRAWIEEAQNLSARSLTLLRPTIRADGSELWASWNPTRKSDAIDEFLRAKRPEGAIVVQANWRDNEWFPKVLDHERRLDLALYPERYDHIWEGDYAKAFDGAYFAKQLAAARLEGRIGRVARDPLLPVPRCSISAAPAPAPTPWRSGSFNGPARKSACSITSRASAKCWRTTSTSYGAGLSKRHLHPATRRRQREQHYRQALRGSSARRRLRSRGGAEPGQGRRRHEDRSSAADFPQGLFNGATTEAGRDALGYYHERKDETLQVGLGPDHDWSSHAADAFGLMAVAYEDPSRAGAQLKPIGIAPRGAGGWMGG
jgi:phage terminase large subunit